MAIPGLNLSLVKGAWIETQISCGVSFIKSCGCHTTYKFQNWKELKGNCNNGSMEHLFLFDALCSSEDLMVKTIAKINYCKSIIGTHTLHLSFCCCSATLNRYINFMQLMSFPLKDASHFWYYLPTVPWQTVFPVVE